MNTKRQIQLTPLPDPGSSAVLQLVPLVNVVQVAALAELMGTVVHAEVVGVLAASAELALLAEAVSTTMTDLMSVQN